MRWILIALMTATVTALALAACAPDAPRAGQAVELHGKLEMRGNVPFVYWVLIDHERVWALEGLTPDRVQSLQNQAVDVHGKLLNAGTGAGRLPSVRVESVTPQP